MCICYFISSRESDLFLGLGFLCFQTADESLNFEEQILAAAQSIAGATAALVKAASAAQRELVEQGKVCTSILQI